MGYTTKFNGELRFTTPLVGKQLAKIKSFFGEDCRDPEHRSWNCDGSYIDLRFNDDFSGIEWDDETEKNNGMVDHINLIIREMRIEYPDFGFTGRMDAQGEEWKDRWCIVIENGMAVRKENPFDGRIVTCPHCDHEFELKEDEQ